jgi:UDP-N-acetylmuramate: L-alanyl-gamma-D-glutamyl-meso-diaminopimelate ligase
MAKKAYFIGIAGKTMAPLAKAFKDMGWEVSGSDHKGVYPPISTYLQENNIPYVEGYNANSVPPDIDLIVAGRSALMIDSHNPEVARARAQGNKVLSFPEVFQDYLIKKNSIVVAGTYGKTTTAALLAWILTKLGKDPSYMASDILLNLPDGVKITNSDFSVVEGDETPIMEKNDKPKFMYYKPKFLLLTATKWDHPEVYQTHEKYIEAFIDLVKLVPEDGLLVHEKDNVDLRIINSALCRKISYSLNNKGADYWVEKHSTVNGLTTFSVKGRKGSLELETVLMGKHNLENICGAVALSLELGFGPETIIQAVRSFKGVKARLEFLGNYSGKYLYSDFAQHHEKVKGSLSALRESFPQSRIVCVFDPSATSLKYRESLEWYKNTFDKVDQVVIGKVGFIKEVAKENRVTGKDIVEAISQTQPNVFYEPTDEKIIDYLRQNTQGGDVIVFMSSGGLRFTNLIQEIIKKLASRD